jgi:thymidine kinase
MRTQPTPKQAGRLTIYAGPMMSGKTTALIAELQDSLEDGNRVLVIKPSIDNRFSDEDVISHDGVSLQKHTGHFVHRIQTDSFPSQELLTNIDVLLVDEIQFFGPHFPEKIEEVLLSGIDVIAVGLDLDSEGKPFKIMPELLSIANSVFKLVGICSVCGEVTATRTFRKLSASSTEQVLIGGAETYEPRCLTHWVQGQEEKLRFFN